MSDDTDIKTGDGTIDSDIQEKLGEKLKDAYSDVLNEPVPDRFVELLNRLSESSPGSEIEAVSDHCDENDDNS